MIRLSFRLSLQSFINVWTYRMPWLREDLYEARSIRSCRCHCQLSVRQTMERPPPPSSIPRPRPLNRPTRAGPLSGCIIRLQSTPRATLHRPSLGAGQQTGGAVRSSDGGRAATLIAVAPAEALRRCGASHFAPSLLGTRLGPVSAVVHHASCALLLRSHCPLSGRSLGLHEELEPSISVRPTLPTPQECS